MSEDKLWSPEMSAQMRQSKRYLAAIRKVGLCAACLHRDKEERTSFGMFKCKLPGDRIHLHCERDGRQPKFQFDPSCLEQFKDAA